LTLTHSLKSINITLGREGHVNTEVEVKIVGQNYGEVKTGDSRRQVKSRKREKESRPFPGGLVCHALCIMGLNLSPACLLCKMG